MADGDALFSDDPPTQQLGLLDHVVVCRHHGVDQLLVDQHTVLGLNDVEVFRPAGAIAFEPELATQEHLRVNPAVVQQVFENLVPAGPEAAGLGAFVRHHDARRGTDRRRAGRPAGCAGRTEDGVLAHAQMPRSSSAAGASSASTNAMISAFLPSDCRSGTRLPSVVPKNCWNTLSTDSRP